ncbi:hypothetical protein HNR01_002995 [Methylorubrum rhodesianum]|uniref:Kiwa anti-phage protein KwaB-like domain-containing protein n=1 Tax=Methylorubrum TaxID=2282523 RepID=UPI00161079F5|nr:MULTISPECIES: Kiwa anti-phage protein KwaB-like domain-containing protein [Methylorubrum]MBB5763363.1 hypothetical protein [Methylorubrum rhodesianum]MBI1691048.1 DUF4868 domain-containing protein [Methylorubrum sp. DB1722]
MITLPDLKGFDLTGADVTVWVFKTSPGQDGRPRFTGRWVGITENLSARLKEAVGSALGEITETIEYDVLVQNNEGSALTIQTDETYVHLIAAEVANDTPGRKARSVKDLANSKFCVIKFVRDEKTMLAVSKNDTSWSTRRTTGFIRAVYSDDELGVEEAPVFTIRPNFDFFVLDERIFIRSKPNFESVLVYKAGHEHAFSTLKQEAQFVALFSDLGPLDEFVGSNKIHLRRAIAIQTKGHYKDASFIARLVAEHKNMSLDIAFDDQGRIVPTAETCRHIFQALLNHRLESRLDSKFYDVPSTEPVA